MKNFLFMLLIVSSSCSHSETASIQASSKKQKESQLNESIGIETLGGVFTALLSKGCELPCSLSQTFSTADDNQEQITIHLFQGEAPIAKQNRSLGKYQISGIAPMPRATASIKVEFVADNSGVTVRATDLLGKSSLKVARIDL